MQMVAVPAPQRRHLDDGDQRLVLRGVPWRTYLMLNDAVEQPSVRMAYCEGELEIMTLGRRHELYKKMIARLLELYALEHDLPLHGYGSMTLREEMKARGLEPDECYSLGRPLVDFPDLAIEVIVTHGGLDKLRIYQGLGVREVWRYADAAFTVFRLRGGRYERASASKLVPGMDFEALARFVVREDQPAAIREFRDSLRVRPAKKKAARRRR
ncbi:MAG: Uma2 family endonuclease [Deltaproteobacteria bacterium]|nr:Uma2 family endonuclease [Deltaproteobacteria bacterium]